MPGIVKRPQIVEEAVEQFADLFQNKCQRDHFGNYLTGLMAGNNKTVTGITDEIVDASDQSCLNRFLTQVDWDENELNKRRIDWLLEQGDIKNHPLGSIAIDNVLIDHDGKFIKDVGWFWDHSEQRHKIAHDYLFVNYVNPDGKHYPLDFRRFRKKDQCEQTNEEFIDHTKLFIELVKLCQTLELLGTFVFDSYFSSSEILDSINALHDARGERRGYVGDLKSNRTITFKGKSMSAAAFAASIAKGVKKQIIHKNGRKQWYFTVCVGVSEVDHKCRIVFLWDKPGDTEPKKILITNKTNWEINRIAGTYRDRWTGTETFHRDGKQELGMGDCQLRSGLGQTRHMVLVMLAYSLAMRCLGNGSLCEWAFHKLKTVGEVCRAMLDETFRSTITWVLDQIGVDGGKRVRNLLRRLRLA